VVFFFPLLLNDLKLLKQKHVTYFSLSWWLKPKRKKTWPLVIALDENGKLTVCKMLSNTSNITRLHELYWSLYRLNLKRQHDAESDLVCLL